MNGKHPHGIITFTAAAQCVKGQIVKFTGSTDANGAPTITPTTSASDAAIGVTETECAAGDRVAVGSPLATLETAREPDALERCAAELLKAFEISQECPPPAKLVLAEI